MALEGIEDVRLLGEYICRSACGNVMSRVCLYDLDAWLNMLWNKIYLSHLDAFLI